MNSSKLEYQVPKKIGEPITVKNGNITIGKVYQNLEGDIPEYSAIDNEGKTICDPTIDWVEIEMAFNGHHRELTENIRTEGMDDWIDQIAIRESELHQIRKDKAYSLNLKPLSI